MGCLPQFARGVCSTPVPLRKMPARSAAGFQVAEKAIPSTKFGRAVTVEHLADVRERWPLRREALQKGGQIIASGRCFAFVQRWNRNQQQGRCHLVDLAPETASWSSRPWNQRKSPITYIHSERLNSESIRQRADGPACRQAGHPDPAPNAFGASAALVNQEEISSRAFSL